MPTTKSLITVPCDRKCERIMLVRYSPPCGDARRGGCVINKMLRSHRSDAAGVGFLLFSIGKPPRPRDQRRLRDIFLIARPPLLLLGLRAAALALRGGDARRGIRSIPILHTLMSAATKIALRNFIILRRPALPGSLLIRRPVFLAAGSDLLLE